LNLLRLAPVLLIVFISTACGDNKVLSADEKRVLSAEDIQGGKDAEKRFEVEHTFEYTGYVRTVMIVQAKLSYSVVDSTMVGFETEDGSLIKILFLNVEPRIWENMHAKIIIQQLHSSAIIHPGHGHRSLVFGETDFKSGDKLYKLVDIKHLK